MTLKTRIERLERHRRTDESLTTRLEPDEHGHQWLSVVRQYRNGDSLTIRLPSKLPI